MAEWNGNADLWESDPELFELIKEEKKRQVEGLELIASENFTSKAVMQANGSCLTNKYSEGLPGRRYYGGNEVIDKIESLCIKRALEAFHLDPEEWGVNVQPYSGSSANFEMYASVLKPHDRIMGLDLPSGGHLSHGYQTDTRKISNTSIFFTSLPYKLDPATGYIDYDALENSASLFRPNLIMCGGSAYPRDFDYERLRKIADARGAYLVCDMAHISGLIASQQMKSPFKYCDMVTSTTHKTLRGPRAGIIFFRKGVKRDSEGAPLTGKRAGTYDFEKRVNESVFPGAQGGPHEHTIAAIATTMYEACSPGFVTYCQKVIENAKAMCESLTKRGYEVITGGTDCHIVLWSLRNKGLTGSKMEYLCELVGISVNKNTVLGDTSALTPGGVRLGSSPLTTRGFTPEDLEKVVDLLDRVCKLALEVQETAGKKLVDWKPAVTNHPTTAELKKEVAEFAKNFPMPGGDW